MKSFRTFLIEAQTGEDAGSFEIANTGVKRAMAYGQQVFGGKLLDVLPNFKRNYMLLRKMDKKYGKTLRKNMPSIGDDQVTGFEASLKPIRSRDGRISASKLHPTQRQLYLDKILAAIKDHGVDDVKKYLTKSKIIADNDRDVIDGHHRWSSAMLIDPRLDVFTSMIKAKRGQVMSRAQLYTDKLGNVRNK